MQHFISLYTVCKGQKDLRQKNTIFFENYNLTSIEMYNALSQIYCIKPLVYKGLIKDPCTSLQEKIREHAVTWKNGNKYIGLFVTCFYSKTCVKWPLKNRQMVRTLMKVESIAECSEGSILQYFWPTLSDNWSSKPIYGLFESVCFTQVLL